MDSHDKEPTIHCPLWLSLLLCTALYAAEPPEDETHHYQFIAPAAGSPASIRCGTNEFPPYTYADESGQAAGVEVEVVKELARRVGVSITVEIMPWPRLLTNMRNKKLDCMFAAFYSAERAQYMAYTSTPIHVSRLAVFVREDARFELGDIDDLKGRRVGMIKGFKTIDALDAI